MKLFQRLLVAPAALGLLVPFSANANEVNLNEISNYSDVESIEFANFNNDISTESNLLAGGEGLMDDHDHSSDDSFSSTTSASFSVDMAIGSVDGNASETVGTAYGYQIDLSTSFTGEDSLDVAIKSGVGAGPLSELDLNSNGAGLAVDGISYTFPVGDIMTAIVGDNTDGSALFTTACAYGGPSNTLDDCGNVNAAITNGGAMAGASYDFDNGLTAAIGYAGAETSLMTKETTDAYGANLAYTADNYGVSLTYGLIETSATAEDTYTALNAYYSLDNGMSISAGYEVGDIGGAAATADESINYFVGVNGEVGPGELGVALGTSGGQVEGQDEELMYEAYYSYPVNDGMTITPLIYQKEQATAGTPDQTGFMVKTSFSF